MMRLTWSSVVMGACLLVAPAAVAQPASGSVCDVLSKEVIGRLGAGVNVTLCETEDLPGPWTSARADANARLGVPSTFTLTGPARSVRIRATVDAVGPHARVVDLVSRGRTLTTDAFRVETGPLSGARIARLAPTATLTGARVTRPLDAGAVVQDLDVALVPIVKPGETVLAVVRIGGVEVSAPMTAVDGGAIGDEIRIAHKDRKRVLQGKVIAAGRVEVVYAR